MPAVADRYFTREEVLAFPADGNRYELVHGELLVSPVPALLHQVVAGRLFRMVADYVERHGIGVAPLSPGDLALGHERDVIVQPDVYVITTDDARATRWEEVRTLLLAVEVLSPSTARYDRFTKRRFYQEVRVPVYWVFDPQQRTAEVWTPDATGPALEAVRLQWHPEGAPSPLVVDLARLFRP